MTQPPFDPAGASSSPEPSPTEPVPPVAPPPAAGRPVTPPPAFAVPSASPEPAPPEPAPGEGWLPPSGPAPGPGPRRSAGGSRFVTLALGAAILVAVVGVAFALGRMTAPVNSRVSERQELGAGPGFDDGNRLPGPGNGDRAFPGRGPGREGFGGLGLTGTVTGVTADSLTVQLDSGLTVTVGLDEGTTYHQQAPATSSDVTTGDTVQVQVSGGFRPGQGQDGSIDLGTAGDVTIVP